MLKFRCCNVSNITGEAYEGSISEPRVADTYEDTGSCENVEVLVDSLETKKQLETQVVSDIKMEMDFLLFMLIWRAFQST